MVFNAMASVFSIRMAMGYTYQGETGLKAFKDLTLSTYIIGMSSRLIFCFHWTNVEQLLLHSDAVLTKYQQTSDKVKIGQRIGRWLTSVKATDTQKKKRRSQLDVDADMDE